MKKSITKSALSLATLAMSAVLPGAPAVAATKVWVSNTGSDSATCGAVTAPCATFQKAHDNVAAGGEIGVLTPGDYGGNGFPARLVISKSVFVTNDGTGEASILQPNSGGQGVYINAHAGDIIGLRGLVIDGQAQSGAGIQILAAAAVNVENCVLRNFEGQFAGYGIYFQPFGNTQLFVSDTLIYNNGSTAGTGGIAILPQASTNNDVVLDRVRVQNNVAGVHVFGQVNAVNGNGVHVILRDSVVSGNLADGILAETQAGKPPAFIVVERTASVNNGGTGIKADGPRATILLSDNFITRNGVAGISAVNSGQLISFGNNKNANNVGPEGAPTGTFSQM